MGRGLERNVQVTILGELGFGRDSIGVGFSPSVGRSYPHDMVKPHWLRALATPHHTPLKLAFGLGCSILHVSHHTPNPRPTIPHGLTCQLVSMF
ncbi:hypothetical protein Hanom_Chr16g01434931 [Helianthus anomalus]